MQWSWENSNRQEPEHCSRWNKSSNSSSQNQEWLRREWITWQLSTWLMQANTENSAPLLPLKRSQNTVNGKMWLYSCCLLFCCFWQQQLPLGTARKGYQAISFDSVLTEIQKLIQNRRIWCSSVMTEKGDDKKSHFKQQVKLFKRFGKSEKKEKGRKLNGRGKA